MTTHFREEPKKRKSVKSRKVGPVLKRELRFLLIVILWSYPQGFASFGYNIA